MPSFLEAYGKVKAAVAANEESHLSHICVREGMMFATNSRMTAAAEVDFDGSFMVPAKEFYQAITVLGEDGCKVKVKDESKLVVYKSRRRVTIATLDQKDFAYNLPEGELLAIPRGFVDALRSVYKFMSDDRTKAWANAVRVKGNSVYATNNITLACSSFDEWGSDVDITIPDWVIEYIVTRQAELQYMSFMPNSVSFNWSDNSWVRSARLSQEMPEVVLDLIAKIEEPEFELSQDWLDAFRTVTQMSGDVLHICPDKIRAGKGHASIEAEVASPVDLEETMWHPKYLELVVAQATHFDPGAWPKPCSWKGDNCRGLIVGRRT